MQKTEIFLAVIITLLIAACQPSSNDEAVSQLDDTKNSEKPMAESSATVTREFILPMSPVSPISPIVVSPNSPVSAPVVENEPTPAILTPVVQVVEEEVVIDTDDKTQLRGTLFGRGEAFVIIIPAPDETGAAWADQARTIAAQGFRVLTLDKFPVDAGIDNQDFDKSLEYLKSAIDFSEEKGTTEHILMGIGDNGIVAIKAAAQTNAKAVVTFSTPIESNNLSVTTADMQAIAGPKLFIDTEFSPTKPAAVQMFDWSNSPKTWRFLPGASQGADMYKEDYRQNLTDFIAAFFLLRLSS